MRNAILGSYEHCHAFVSRSQTTGAADGKRHTYHMEFGLYSREEQADSYRSKVKHKHMYICMYFYIHTHTHMYNTHRKAST